MIKKEDLIARLQELGAENINPNSGKAELQEMLAKLEQPKPPETAPKTDIQMLMEAVSGLVANVKSINDEMSRMKEGGKNDFKNDMKQEDVDEAAKMKANLNPKVVQIVEEILGVDFGIEVIPNPDSPGFQLTVLVPKRLSPIEGSTRPVINPETGVYKKDPKTDLPIEESYWPGDRRSRAVGSTDSFDLIREHCNKVRAHIITYYEKARKPLPEFKIR